MKLNQDGFIRHLSQKNPAPVYLIEGNETLLVEEALDALALMLKENGFVERLSYFVETGFKIQDLDVLTQNFSLFANKKRLVIHCEARIPAELSNWVVDYCTKASHYKDVCLVFKCPKLNSVDKKAKWVKAIEDAGIICSIATMNLADFPTWLDKRLLSAGLRLEAEARIAMIEQTEGNLLAAAQLVKKMALFNPTQPLSLAEIEPLLSEEARYDLFDLSKYTLLGDVKRSVRILQYLSQELEAVLVLWALSKELKTLLLLYTRAGKESPTELYRSLQIWDSRKREVESALKRLTPKKTAMLLSSCAKIDLAIKGLHDEDPWQMLKVLVTNIAVPSTIN